MVLFKVLAKLLYGYQPWTFEGLSNTCFQEYAKPKTTLIPRLRIAAFNASFAEIYQKQQNAAHKPDPVTICEASGRNIITHLPTYSTTTLLIHLIWLAISSHYLTNQHNLINKAIIIETKISKRTRTKIINKKKKQTIVIFTKHLKGELSPNFRKHSVVDNLESKTQIYVNY